MGKKFIKNFCARDKNALISISRCGHVSHNQLKNYSADSRIKNYCRDGLIEKQVFNKSNGEQLVGYKLTATGRKFVEREYGINNHQIAQSLTHDLGISNKYFSLTEQEQNTWRTETELRRALEEKIEYMKEINFDRYREVEEQLNDKQISTPDCAYTSSEGIEITYEVTTNSYSKAEIEAKENFATVMECEIEFERV